MLVRLHALSTTRAGVGIRGSALRSTMNAVHIQADLAAHSIVMVRRTLERMLLVVGDDIFEFFNQEP